MRPPDRIISRNEKRSWKMAAWPWPSWPFKRDAKKEKLPPPSELRIATSGSFSIRAGIENLRVDGAGSYSQPGRVRAALFVPSTTTTVQFHGDGTKRLGANARSSCVHVLQMFTPEETASILDDAKRIGGTIGWSDRGVSLPTQDVLVQNLGKESQDLIHKAIREQLLPFARRHYPHLNAAFDKQPYPRPGNLFIVRYSAACSRPGGRGLKMHKDETALTFNMCLSPQDGFEGGGTYFPAASGDVDGILLRPTPGYCLIHDGKYILSRTHSVAPRGRCATHHLCTWCRRLLLPCLLACSHSANPTRSWSPR